MTNIKQTPLYQKACVQGRLAIEDMFDTTGRETNLQNIWNAIAQLGPNLLRKEVRQVVQNFGVGEFLDLMNRAYPELKLKHNYKWTWTQFCHFNENPFDGNDLKPIIVSLEDYQEIEKLRAEVKRLKQEIQAQKDSMTQKFDLYEKVEVTLPGKITDVELTEEGYQYSINSEEYDGEVEGIPQKYITSKKANKR